MKRVCWGVFVLALILRLVGIGEHPAGFTPDEASFGYDAYSILKTGKDQWGDTLPLTLKSFGDGKMPLYAYLAIPSVAVFGLNEFAVRLPNALLGSLAVWVTYELVKEWRKDEREAALAALILAVSPWHVPMSRGAFEANLTTFFLPLGVWLFLKGLRDGRFLLGAAAVWGLNLFSYHSARLVTPVVVMALVWQYRGELKKVRQGKMAAAIFGVVVVMAGLTYLGRAGARVKSAGIFSLAGEAGNTGNKRYEGVMVGLPDVVARGFNNKLTHVAELLSQNYVQYFSPQFLFTNGPGEYTYGMVPGRGVLYFIEVLFLGGFVAVLVKEELRKGWWLIVWLMVAALPAAMTIGPGYAANRAAVMMPALQIGLAIGGVWLGKLLKVGRRGAVVYGGVWLVAFLFFCEDYFVQQRAYGVGAMIYGMDKVYEELRRHERDYEQVVVSKSISEPQIYTAFYLKWDPEDYQKAAKEWKFEEEGLGWVDQLASYSLGKYEFRGVNWGLDSRNTVSLFVGRPGEFGEAQEQVLAEVHYPDGKVAYWIVGAGRKALAYEGAN